MLKILCREKRPGRWMGSAAVGIAALCLLGGDLAAQARRASGPRPVFDARLSLKPGIPTAAEAAVIKGPVRTAARKHWGRTPGVDEAFEIIDVASGSFTRPGAKQRAISYILARTGHNFGQDGIAILENGRLVTHILYEGAWENALGALPDINRNGRSELLRAAGGINIGITWQAIGIIELTRDGVLDLGNGRVYEDDCGVGGARASETAYRLLVTPGSPPVFHREAFGRPCGGKTWKTAGARKPFTLENHETVYTRLP